METKEQQESQCLSIDGSLKVQVLKDLSFLVFVSFSSSEADL